jgi:type IV pilus assembly protein PilE
MNTYYTFGLSNLAARTYTVTATPIGSQLSADATCNALSINQSGARSISGTGSVTNCF